MKLMSDNVDFLCLSGRPSDISSNLNKIYKIYDLTVLSTSVSDSGTVTVIVERRKRDNGQKDSINIPAKV